MIQPSSEVISLDIDQILSLLPHRFPFLMIDRVVAVTIGDRLTAIKNVTVNEPCFTGHFPENPVMPGVLILEALAQAAAILAYLTDGDTARDSLHLLGSIRNARFKQVVRPGDQLELNVQLTSKRTQFCKVHAEAKVQGKVVCSADIMSAKKEL